MRHPHRWLAVALLLLLAGGLVAWRAQTAGGTVAVHDVRWVAPSGTAMSGLLYVPDGATPATPAPGVLAIHGYINSRETQAGFAIELARRGYVVLALDQTGHGYSAPPAMAEGFGGPAGLAYLRALDFVDRENIGLEGHSMGGWAAGHAAAAFPDGYRAMVLAGSSTGTAGAPVGTPEFPRNLAVVWSLWDEFSATMWDTPVPAEVRRSEKLKAVFGTHADVEVGKMYGSVEAGTARMLYMPRTNHPGDHLSTAAIGDAVEWFGTTLEGGSGLPPDDQIWYWKELGSLLGALGMVLLLLPVGAILLRTRYFSGLAGEPAPSRAGRGAGWWAAALLTAALGPLTLFPFKSLPAALGWSPGPLFPQGITNAVVAWTTLLGLVTLALLLLGHLATKRGRRAGGREYGLTGGRGLSPGLVGKSLLLACLVVLSGYAALLLTDFLFGTDFRFWVFAIKPMSPLQLRMALVYFVPLAFYFLTLNVVVFALLRRDEWGPGRATLVNAAVLAAGWVALYLYQYVPLLAGGTLAVASEPLWTIVSYQLLPLMAIAAVLLTFFNRATGRVYVGGFTVALLVSWIVVASQATHVAP